MAGILGSIGLLSSSLASKLLLPHHHNRQIKTPLVHMRTRCTLKQQQQHNDNRLKKIVVVNHAHKCTLKKQQQQQQHNDNRLKKIVVVNHAHKESPEISLLSITDVEGINEKITISSTSGGVPIASCHGLFLTTEGRRLNIWNPSSKDDDDEVIRTIPQSSVPRPPTLVYETHLMFGFGFDPSSNDYKVIRFVDFDCNDGSLYNFYLCNWVVELYSLKTQSWKQIAYPHGLAAYLADYTCVYINGFCYWKMLAPQSGRLLILPFDLANDTFPSLIPGPNGLVGFKFQLVEFEGSLAVVAFEYEPFEFELWVWNNNDESWSKRGAWAINGDVNFYIPVGRVFKNDKIFLQNSMRELVLFDFAKQKLENLGFYAVHGLSLRIYPYVESSAEDIK